MGLGVFGLVIMVQQPGNPYPAPVRYLSGICRGENGTGYLYYRPECTGCFQCSTCRAIPGVTPKTSITWEDVWKERRLELACEGDRWYDYVRLAYYDSQRAINELKAQRRDVYYSLGTTYKAYYENGSWTVNPDETRYNPDAKAPNVTVSSFTLPFPTEDVVFNPNLMKDPVHVDVRSEFSY